MPRFEVNEVVILKERGTILYQGIITDVLNISGSDFWPSVPYPVYRVVRINTTHFRYALDNENRCQYLRGFPFCRVHKLEEE